MQVVHFFKPNPPLMGFPMHSLVIMLEYKLYMSEYDAHYCHYEYTIFFKDFIEVF